MTKLRMFTTAAAFLILAACAHHKDVRPGADGIHRVVLETNDTEGAARKCIKEANNFCGETGQHPAFINEDKKYTNTNMSEADFKKVRIASRVAEGVGGAIWVFGGKTESALGGIIGAAGGITEMAVGKGYTVEMRFKCL